MVNVLPQRQDNSLILFPTLPLKDLFRLLKSPLLAISSTIPRRAEMLQANALDERESFLLIAKTGPQNGHYFTLRTTLQSPDIWRPWWRLSAH